MQKVFTRVITKGHRQITILQRLPILGRVLILILVTIMIPFILALTFSILLTLIFAISVIILCIRWFSMVANEDDHVGVGDMKVPTFYATESEKSRDGVARVFCMPVVGAVFGGIHCIGWFFDFPSSDEAAMLWRVSSAVLTGTAFLLPILYIFVIGLLGDSIRRTIKGNILHMLFLQSCY